MTTLTTLEINSTPMGELLGIMADNINNKIEESWMVEAVCGHMLFTVLRSPNSRLIDDGYDLVTVNTVRRWENYFRES